MFNITNLGCCGIKEIAGVSFYANSPQTLMKDLVRTYARDASKTSAFPCGVFLFSEAGPVTDSRYQYATRLAKYIERCKLGTVATVPPFKNPNSGNEVRTFIWEYDTKAVRAWIAKHNIVPDAQKAYDAEVDRRSRSNW